MPIDLKLQPHLAAAVELSDGEARLVGFRGRRGLALLERALALVGEPVEPGIPAAPAPYSIEPACRARIAANARLILGRYHASQGDPRRARAILELAAAVDPDGAIGDAVREELLVRSALHARATTPG